MSDYPKISQEGYDKALFHLRSQLNAVWNFANCHGLNYKVPIAIEDSIKLTEQFSKVMQGEDIMIKVREKPSRKPTE